MNLNNQNISKASDLVCAAIARHLMKNNADGIEQFVMSRWGRAEIVKAAVPPITIPDLDYDPIGLANRAFINAVSEVTVLGRLTGLRIYKYNTRFITPNTGTTASFVAEGKAIPVGTMKFENYGLPPAKVAGILVTTKETVEGSSSVELTITADLIRAVAKAEDVAFLNPANDGSTDAPASITNGVTAITATADPKADLKALVASFEGDLSTAYFVMKPELAVALSSADNPDIGARGGALLGIPVITSNGSPAGQITLVDPTGIAFAPGGAEIQASQQGSLQMDDQPDHDADTPASTTLLSLWQHNLVAFLARRSLSWRVVRGGSVGLITGATY